MDTTSNEDSQWLTRQLTRGGVRATLVALQAVCLSIAAFAGFCLAEHHPGRDWIASRLLAEEGRLTLARRALEIGHEKSQALFIDAGEWFLDFVQEQKSHLEASSNKRDAAASDLIHLGGLVAAITALSGALAGFQAELIVILIAILGVLTPALIAAIRSWRDAVQDRRRAELHRKSLRLLTEVGEEENHFRQALKENDLHTVLDYAEKVFAILATDHAEFSAAYKHLNRG